jgi:hypothetical protein
VSSATQPEVYPNGVTTYQTVNRPDISPVRDLYGNAMALKAAPEGRSLPDGLVLVLEPHAAKPGNDKRPVVGSDGFFVRDRFLAYAIMATRPVATKTSPRPCVARAGTTPL